METEWCIPIDSHEASCVLLHTSTENCALVWDVKKTCICSATAAALIFQADIREKDLLLDVQGSCIIYSIFISKIKASFIS